MVRSGAIRGQPHRTFAAGPPGPRSLGDPLRLGSPCVARSSTPLGLPPDRPLHRLWMRDVPAAGGGDVRPQDAAVCRGWVRTRNLTRGNRLWGGNWRLKSDRTLFAGVLLWLASV